jgi:hypothetical protein
MDLDGRMHSMLRNVLGLMLTYTVTKNSSWLGVTNKAEVRQTRRAFRTVVAGVYVPGI